MHRDIEGITSDAQLLGQEEALPISLFQALYRLFSLSVDILCIADFHGHFQLINPAFTHILGYTEAELLDTPFLELVHPEDRERTRSVYEKKCKEGEDVLYFKNRYRAKSGRYVWLSWIAQTDEKEKLIFASARDIGEQRKANAMLKTAFQKNSKQLNIALKDLINEIRERHKAHRAFLNSEKRYRTLTSIVPTGVFYTNAVGDSLYANDKWVSITGMRKEDAAGDGWLAAVHRDDRAKVKLAWKEAMVNKAHFKMRFRYQPVQNKTIHVVMEAVPQFGERKVFQGYAGTLMDITKLREAELSVHATQRKLAEFDRLNLAGELATGIAHEVNQPLTAIRQYAGGCVTLLERENVSEEVREALVKISNLAEKSADIVNRLRNFLCSGRLQKQKVSVGMLISDIYPIIELQFKKHKILFHVDADDSLPLIEVDKIQIQQVIINILQNSIDAIKKLNTKNPVISIEAGLSKDNQCLDVCVSDNGGGVDSTVINKLFEQFVSTKENGMGIGLSISQSIVQAHGGEILVDSTPGKGAKFHVLLPLAY